MSLHVVALICAVVAGACFLLAAFGVHVFDKIDLIALGLLFFVGASAAHGHHHHA